MSEAMGEKRGPFTWLRRADDALFRVEQAVVVSCLLAITLMVFVDVLARRITAPDSKVGQILAALSGMESAEDIAWLDTQVTPYATVGLSVLMLGFAFLSARRLAAQARSSEKTKEAAPTGMAYRMKPWLLALGLTGLGYLFAVVFEQLTSAQVYAMFLGAACLGFVLHALRSRRPGFMLRVGLALVMGVVGISTVLANIPQGYTWSKKLSLMLLLWVGFFGASVCAHEGKHLRMEAASALVPESWRRYVRALGFLVGAAFCGLMAWLGFVYVFEPVVSDDRMLPELFVLGGQRYALGSTGAYALGGLVEGTEIPDWLTTVAVPIAFGITMLRFFGAAVSSALGGSYGAPALAEGVEEAQEQAKAQKESALEVEEDSEAEMSGEDSR